MPQLTWITHSATRDNNGGEERREKLFLHHQDQGLLALTHREGELVGVGVGGAAAAADSQVVT